MVDTDRMLIEKNRLMLNYDEIQQSIHVREARRMTIRIEGMQVDPLAPRRICKSVPAQSHSLGERIPGIRSMDVGVSELVIAIGS